MHRQNVRKATQAAQHGRNYSSPPGRLPEKHVRTQIKIDYNNGQIVLDRPDWPASALPEPWVYRIFLNRRINAIKFILPATSKPQPNLVMPRSF